MHRDCPVCQLVYLRNQGDTWIHWILTDRIPIAVGLILSVFFGLGGAAAAECRGVSESLHDDPVRA